MSCRCRNADLFQGPSLRFQIGLRVVVSGVEAHVAKPAADDRDIDARRDKVHSGGVTEAVWRHMLGSQRWHGFGCRFNISHKLEPDARGAERLAVAVNEHPRVWRSRLPFQQLFQQQRGFWPEWADALLTALAKEPHATRAIEPDGLRTQIERFLYSCPAIVEEREQRVIAQAFERRAVWLGKDRRHFRLIQIT